MLGVSPDAARVLALVARLEDNAERARRLGELARPDMPRPGSDWSPAQCLEHLNRATESLLPVVARWVETLPAARGESGWDGSGWRLFVLAHPWTRVVRGRTIPAWEPTAAPVMGEVLTRFADLQAELVRRCRELAGKDLARARGEWPPARGTLVNGYALLRVLEAHQRRHLHQAAPSYRRESARLWGSRRQPWEDDGPRGGGRD